jgi:hypothetical protein
MGMGGGMMPPTGMMGTDMPGMMPPMPLPAPPPRAKPKKKGKPKKGAKAKAKPKGRPAAKKPMHKMPGGSMMPGAKHPR